MDLDITAILNQALPGTRATGVTSLGAHSQLLALSDGQRVVLRMGDTTAEARALQLLAGEIDLPLPALVASGEGWLLRSHLAGTPLPEALGGIDEAGRYALGRQIGETLHRVHRIRAPRYGSLDGEDALASRDNLAYVMRRAEASIAASRAGGALDDALAEQLREWLAREYAATNRAPALVHGGLRPEHIVVRARAGTPTLSGIVGWGRAQGWAPGWDHAQLMEAFADNAFFALRVGYAEAYDDLTELVDEQAREFALRPFRLLLHLEALPAADAAGRAVAQRLLAALSARREDDDDEAPDTALTA
jgi:aminoglycoside phosphotransferase (APT) family kinase protein